jgi:hypothetical protein
MLKHEKNLYFIKTYILDLLNIISNNMNLEISDKYLDLVNESTPNTPIIKYKYNVTIEKYENPKNKIMNTKKYANISYYKKDKLYNNLIVKDKYENNGYKDIKLIAYKKNKKRKKKKKNKPDYVRKYCIGKIYEFNEKVIISEWPINDMELYKDIIEHKIIYYHKFIDCNKVYLYYEINKKINRKEISFNVFVNILSRIYNLESIIKIFE